MAQLIFGTKKHIQFNSDNDFFEALGFLAKNNDTTSIHWENNEASGAWGSEGRIHCYKNIAIFPSYFSSAFTAGNGRILHRINCNKYIEYIVNTHKFAYGSTQNNNNILATVPAINLIDFNRGLAI